MLEARSLIIDEVEVEFGDGKGVDFWHDPWCELGSIWEFLSHEERASIQVGQGSKISDIASIAEPGAKRMTGKIRRVMDAFKAIRLKVGADQWKWKSKSGQFSYAGLWQNVRVKKDEVDWSNILWSRRGVPRKDFIAWLMMRGKLNTKDRLLSWGIVHDSKCLFCDGIESRDHLFMDCSFSSRLFKSLMCKLGYNGIQCSWSEVLEWWQSCKGKSFKKHLVRICMSSLVYFIC